MLGAKGETVWMPWMEALGMGMRLLPCRIERQPSPARLCSARPSPVAQQSILQPAG